MSKEFIKFWPKCPKCGCKFGVEPIVIMEYIGQMIDLTKHDISGLEEVLTHQQGKLENTFEEIEKDRDEERE